MSCRLLCLVILAAVAQCARADEPTRLPRVLIIGDSISLGYTPHVVELLKGKAVVVHSPGNSQHTGTGLLKLDAWLGKEKWAVIHFNWGLWDLCYRNPESKTQGNRDKANGKITTSLEAYEKNLDELTSRLKKTGARLVWANTTFVPTDELGRKQGDDAKYNAAAARIMKKHDVEINDLFELTKEFDATLFSKPGDVHYTKAGYAKIAEAVAKAIVDKE